MTTPSTTTRRAARGRGQGPVMICPEVEDSTGEVVGGYPDVRVPSWLVYDHPARLIAWFHQSRACPDGRHGWDALIAVGHESLTGPDPDADDYDPGDPLGRAEVFERGVVGTQPFRLVLTCTRCGLIEDLSGVLHHGPGHRARRVHPVPITAGDLIAQQVSAQAPVTYADTDPAALTGHWTIHHAHTTSATVIGQITPHRGRRGRLTHVGRLTSWPEDVSVTAPTPAACLRKVARGLPPTPREDS